MGQWAVLSLYGMELQPDADAGRLKKAHYLVAKLQS
jgi:hypothetical protein